MVRISLRMCLAIIFLSWIGQSALASMNESQGICIPCSADNYSANFGPALTEEILPHHSNSANRMNAQNVQSLSRPNRPDRPEGPDDGQVNTKLTFSTMAKNPSGGWIKYIFEFWDHGQPTYHQTGFVQPGKTVTDSYIWSHCGNGLVRVRVEDKSGSSSEWSDIKKILIWTIPSTPCKPIGPTNVVVGHHFNYQTRSFDSCGNLIKYPLVGGERLYSRVTLLLGVRRLGK